MYYNSVISVSLTLFLTRTRRQAAHRFIQKLFLIIQAHIKFCTLIQDECHSPLSVTATSYKILQAAFKGILVMKWRWKKIITDILNPLFRRKDSFKIMSLCSSCWSWCEAGNLLNVVDSLCSPAWSPLREERKTQFLILYTQPVKNTKTAQTNLFIDASREPLTNLFELRRKINKLNFHSDRQNNIPWAYLWTESENNTWRCCKTAAWQWSSGALPPPAVCPRAVQLAGPETWGSGWRCCGWCSWLELLSLSANPWRVKRGDEC